MQDGGLSFKIKRLRHMFVHIPTSMGDCIIKNTSCFNVVLGENMIPLEAPPFPLTGETADPVKSPPLSTSVWMVLDVCPHTVSNLEQFFANLFRIVESVLYTTERDPPEIVVPPRTPVTMERNIIIVENICPVREPKRTIVSLLPAQLHDNRAA